METGFPTPPPGMWWRIEPCKYSYLTSMTNENLYGKPRVLLMANRDYQKSVTRWWGKDGTKTVTYEDNVESAFIRSDDYECRALSFEEVTQEDIFRTAKGILNKYNKYLAWKASRDALVGDYPPKSLLNG